jgi:hypothetical protein
MEWHFAMPGTAVGNTCRLEKSFWLGRTRLFYRGREVARSTEKGKPFLVQLPEGGVARVAVRLNGLDYLPKVEIDGRPLELDRPLSTLEYVLGGLPLILVFAGGAIGGFAGAVGTVFNYRLMRTDADLAVKSAGVVGITLASLMAYLVLVVMFRAAIGK